MRAGWEGMAVLGLLNVLLPETGGKGAGSQEGLQSRCEVGIRWPPTLAMWTLHGAPCSR